MRTLFIAIALTGFLRILGLSACSRRQPEDSVEGLMANHERLKTLRAQCRSDHEKVGDAQCNRVAEATRRRFMDGRTSPYKDDAVAPPAPPAPAASSSGK